MFEKYLNNKILTLFFLPLLLGSITVFSFQPFNFTLVNFFILPIIFFLLVFIKKKSKSIYRKKPYLKNLFIFSTMFGFSFFLSGLYWITFSLTFDESFKILIPLCLLLIPLFLSLFFSIAVIIVGPFLSLNLSSIFLFSGSLAFADYLRSKILTGFPWNLWAYSFSWNTELIQISNMIGLFAYNLIIITIFMLPAILFFKISILKKFLSLVLLIILLLISYIFGSHRINLNNKLLNTTDIKYNIKVISPNFELKYGLSINEIDERLEKLIRYSDPSDNLKTLFIWPEGVFGSYSYEKLRKFKKKLSKSFNKNHLILLGLNRLNNDGTGFYNSLVIVNNRMEIVEEYNKQKLVPFGEFLPLEKTLNKFGLKKITEGHGSFLKGIKQKNLLVGDLNILPLICYEIIFTEFIQKSENGTNLIVNISEDGWFGNSIGPNQHFAKAIFRAIEHNSFLIRSANKGISAIINNKGQVVKKLKPGEAGNIELEVPLIKSENRIKNDLIFFSLLITYILFFKFYKKNNDK
tara:strand:- start:11849 stop:13411 length:1563 start_codon:yes stop_codon:yes gene_type:complete